ncbi:heavy-metal-associated domain-containing protein [Microvirga rosea]|uniref:heavy-metal-associated domain-containing protein n=1 Tax=Microvirga rosea TaxID=2715425 RepID=UPI001D0A1661|nr:heavy-metal-associated domain-containing protein [Microvirga rosea]MCB8823269.1 heavy-metal-associated domain-containing protein [Microvirga rosea]
MHSFHVPTMSCGGCLRTVTRAIQALDPQAGVHGDLERQTIDVASTATRDSLLQTLQEAGYPAASEKVALG